MSDSACRAVLDSYGPHCQWAWPCSTRKLATTTERGSA